MGKTTKMGVYDLEIDASELSEILDRMRGVLSTQRFNQILNSVTYRTGQHVKQILKEDLPMQYVIKPTPVGKAVGGARMSGTGCTIPIFGPRRDIGGTRGRGFPASGGAKGWKIKGPYKITAEIVKGHPSELPAIMKNYGGMPPFRNLAAKKLHNLAFTRAGKKRLPIHKVVAIGIPQMPMNRSKDEVQADIVSYMMKRLDHEFQRALAGK